MGEHGGSHAGGLVRAFRQKAGLTQRQLAQVAGVSVGVVRDLEQGRTARLHTESVRRLASALRLDRQQARELSLAARVPADGAAARVQTGELRISVLGPVAAWRHGAPVALGPPMQRAVLGLLAVYTGTGLSRSVVTDALWGEDPPMTAASMLLSYISRLRRLLGPGGPVRTTGNGYRLEPAACELDLLIFGGLVRHAQKAQAAGELATACQAYADAIALWRGDPLADCDILQGHPAVVRLSQQKADAVTGYADAAIAARCPDRILPHLRELTDREPLNERAHALLMIALAGSGQQATALGVFDQMQRRLDNELGIRPGPELTAAQVQVLSQQIPVGPATASAAAAAARPRPAARHFPGQLPCAVAHFTGRTVELAALNTALDQAAGRTIVISAIAGTAGVGKTALAIQWAHQVTGHFPDGQLYVNLRGYDPDQPMPAADALARFLRALGVPGQDIPAEEDERAARYRSLLVGKRVLVMLDNAGSAEQVRPLLPGTPACTVMVTSRDALAGLVARDGATRLELDLLPLEEAVDLLRTLIGARVDAAPDAAAELAAQCCRLPLALRVAAELATSRPGVPLTQLTRELADLHKRLDLLAAGGDRRAAVRAVFSWSYQHLGADAARGFRLLGLHPGPDFEPYAAAVVTGTTAEHARRVLGELSRAHLIAEHVPGRYAFHDLLRAYAAEQARHTDSDAARREATGRVLDHYLHTAARAALLLVPGKEPVVLAPPRPGAAPGRPADRTQALAWFEAEHQVLLAAGSLAAGSGFDRHAWQLPWATADFLEARGHWQEWATAQRTALAAATRLGDIAAQALSGRLLANACRGLGDHDQARVRFADSLTLYQRLGNRHGEARIRQGLGMLAERQGRYADAIGHAEQALRLFQAIGDKAAEAAVLNSIGWYHDLLGDYQQARAFSRQALSLCAQAGHRRTEGFAWHSVGYAEHHLGNLAEAAACYQRSISILRESGDRFFEAGALTHLGDNRLATGELTQARQAWQQALAILEDLQHPDAGPVRTKLASTNHRASANPPR